MSFVGPSETGRSQFIYNWLQIGIFETKIDEHYNFYQNSQPVYDVTQRNDNVEFVRGVSFQCIDSLKNNGTKYLVILDGSCEKICNSKAFDENATAGRL